jgi:diguanylate cyclase (GGDEF)-like protein
MGKIPGFAYRTLLLMGATPLRKQVAESLQEAGFVVDCRDHEVDPWDLTPSERPDLVVLGTDITTDPLARVRFWSSATADRPRAVVLADPLDRLDRLRSAAAGVDAVFGSASLPDGLVAYARALAQIGAPPANVVVVEDDPAQAQMLAVWLEQINARVRICNSAQMARDTLSTETPDLVLLDVDLPDIDGYAVARLMRQDPRLALVPIVFLTARKTLSDEMDGLRAGGDDFLAKPVERSLLLQVVLTRTERGRRIRELVHRDALTGASNHATLMAELDHAIAFSGRHGEPLCFLMLDLDHFKRINDTYGHMVGDQVLQHVAGIFRRAIRNSDLLGRYGGEEFGIILRRCPPANGRTIAAKLQRELEENPLTLGPETSILTRVSIGIATFPGSGESAADVTMAADRALYKAKSSGRDRIEMA